MRLFTLFGQTQFGKLPSGERLKRIQKSPHYKNGAFQNLSHTPDLTDGATYFSVSKDFFFGKHERRFPERLIPSVKTNLHHIPKQENVLVWFGHSSYYMQIEGKRILVDPVLSGNASPFSFTTKAFKGSDVYKAEDLPEIDYLFLTHDHYDHLDYRTVVKLRSKVKTVICSLGTGSHLEYWAYEPSSLREMDWHEHFDLEEGFKVYSVPARHFSGRGFKRNQTLWSSFVLKTPAQQIFIGGDSGYDTHFAEIGKQFGGFDLAILENGQYNNNWKHIHLMPDEILQAAKDLQAKRLFPVHSSKFALGTHPWDEPLNLISKNNTFEKLNLITPMIGEKVELQNPEQLFSEWWK
ncbi:MAG: MBL fold metallo-hydrolase [Bacteroidia bacterium]|jgi:L-ascorbate metabolism protein UlaG (beta-lactamase superfamily)|nr:MBL fold metallo-hydrolase [Bacteroidia bacterium]